MNAANSTALTEAPRRSILATMAAKFDMEPVAFEATLRGTVMKRDRDGNEATKEEFAAFLVVASQYNLNPLTKEIYAFFDRQRGGIIPIVGIDGWSRIINEHSMFDGMSFLDTHDDKGALISTTCRIHRKDRGQPIEVTEYLSECKRDTTPWKTWPRRMLRHKAMIQCARYAFGFSGIYDEDEAERIAASKARDVTPSIAQERLGPMEGPLGKLLTQRAPAPSQDIRTHVQNEISGAPPPAPESPASEDVSAPSRSEEAGVGPDAAPPADRASGPFFTGADAARVKVIAEALRGAVSDEDVNEVFRVHLKPLGKEHPVVKGVSVLFSLTRDRITGDADPDQFNEELVQLVGGE